MKDLILPYRDSKGRFCILEKGTLIQKLSDSTHSMQNVFFVVIAHNKGMVASIPYTSNVTNLHAHNFKCSKDKGIKIVRVLTEKEKKDWAFEIQIQINKNQNPAYNSIGTNAKFLIEKILLKNES